MGQRASGGSRLGAEPICGLGAQKGDKAARAAYLILHDVVGDRRLQRQPPHDGGGNAAKQQGRNEGHLRGRGPRPRQESARNLRKKVKRAPNPPVKPLLLQRLVVGQRPTPRKIHSSSSGNPSSRLFLESRTPG